MIKSITNFLIIFFIFQQLKSQISQIDQNGVNPFCDETLQIQEIYARVQNFRQAFVAHKFSSFWDFGGLFFLSFFQAPYMYGK